MIRSCLLLRSDPRDPVALEEIGVTIQSLVMLFATPFLRQTARRKSDTVVEHSWQEQRKKGAATVVVIDDAELPARYLFVTGRDRTHGEHVWRNLEYLLPVMKRDELLAAARSPGESRGSLTRLALTLEGIEQEALELIASGLGHEGLDVRMDAAQAIVCLKWRRFRPYVEAALAQEKEEEGRKGLSFAIQLLDERGVEA